MAKIKDFSTKGVKSRERNRRCRAKKKIREKYEIQVRQQVRIIEESKRIDIDDNNESQIDNCEQNQSFTREQSSEKLYSLEDELRAWSIKHRITLSALNELLSILILAGFTFLPRDSRTLKRTPKKVDICNMGDGQFWYYGMRKCLEHVFRGNNQDLTITLDFNFDGAPLFESSKLGFWPILSSIRGDYSLYYNTKQLNCLIIDSFTMGFIMAFCQFTLSIVYVVLLRISKNSPYGDRNLVR